MLGDRHHVVLSTEFLVSLINTRDVIIMGGSSLSVVVVLIMLTTDYYR